MSEMITFMVENEVKEYEFKLEHRNNIEKRIVATEKSY